MTETEFDKKFGGVLDRAYAWSSKTRGPAPWPAMKAKCINVMNIEEECRPKDACISYEPNGIHVDWMTQEDCDEHYELDAEVVRCMKAIGFSGKIFMHVHDRDGYNDFRYSLEA